MLRQQVRHRPPGALGGNVRVKPGIEEQRVRYAGDAGLRKEFGGRRLVIGNAARNRTVQSDVIAEDKVSSGALLHHDQPAVRADVDVDRMPLAIAPNRVHEDPSRAGHTRPRSMDGCPAVAATLNRRGSAARRLEELVRAPPSGWNKN